MSQLLLIIVACKVNARSICIMIDCSLSRKSLFIISCNHQDSCSTHICHVNKEEEFKIHHFVRADKWNFYNVCYVIQHSAIQFSKPLDSKKIAHLE